MFIFFYPKAGNANGGKYYFGEKHRVWCNNKLHKSLTYLQNWRSEDQIISLLSLEASLKLLLKFLLKIKKMQFFVSDPISWIFFHPFFFTYFRASSQRSGEMTPPQTPPASKLETTVPTFNIISATPTPSVGETRQQTPENNNIQEQSKRDMVVVTTS